MGAFEVERDGIGEDVISEHGSSGNFNQMASCYARIDECSYRVGLISELAGAVV